MDGRGAFSSRIPSVESDDPLAVLERLYGPVTARSRAGLMPETASITALDEDPRVTALREPGAAEGAFSLMGDVAMQPVRAGEALGEAIYDPSLGNVTNAGVQTALTFGKPYAAVGAAGLGLAEGLRRDMGLDYFGSSDAANLTRRQQREMEMERQRRDAEAAADIKRIEAEAKAKAGLEAEKERIAAEAAVKAAKRAEYDRAVAKAEEFRDRELARDRRFSDSHVGKVYEKTGGSAPFLAAIGAGGLHRLMRPGSGTFLDKYVAPTIEGAGAAFAANALPSYYNMRYPEPDNPEKRAFSAYSRELPEGHPNKQKYADLADKLPSLNPVREAANEDWAKNKFSMMEQSALEGLTGIIGANGIRVGARLFGSKAPDVSPNPTKPPGRVSKWLESLFGKEAAAPPATPPTTGGPAPKGKTVKPKWNEKTQRYHGAHNHIVKGGKPPK